MCLYFTKKVYEKSKVSPAPVPQLGTFVNTTEIIQTNENSTNQISQNSHDSPRPSSSSKLDQSNVNNIIFVKEQESKNDTESQEVKDETDKNIEIQNDDENKETIRKQHKEVFTLDSIVRRQNSNPHQFFKINVKRRVPTFQSLPVAVDVAKKALNVNLLSLCQICVFLPLNILPLFLHYFPEESCAENIVIRAMAGLFLLVTIVGLIGFPLLSEKKLDNF